MLFSCSKTSKVWREEKKTSVSHILQDDTKGIFKCTKSHKARLQSRHERPLGLEEMKENEQQSRGFPRASTLMSRSTAALLRGAASLCTGTAIRTLSYFVSHSRMVPAGIPLKMRALINLSYRGLRQAKSGCQQKPGIAFR